MKTRTITREKIRQIELGEWRIRFWIKHGTTEEYRYDLADFAKRTLQNCPMEPTDEDSISRIADLIRLNIRSKQLAAFEVTWRGQGEVVYFDWP